MAFNHTQEIYNTKSAEIVVPILLELFQPKSVLDVGCGIGTWLAVFEQHGIEDYLGVDGNYVDRDVLNTYIKKTSFYPYDLRNELMLNRKYDLVISLEVAEHIEEMYANDFLKTLINHSDIIVFSAAIPKQGGENHLNEQWMSYWIEKFSAHNYFAHDIIRPQIWNNKKVDFWYKQNMIVFKKGERNNSKILDIVHPVHFLLKDAFLNNEIKLLREGALGFRFYLKLCLVSLRIKMRKYFNVLKSN
ncbi:MAG: class I SAM-dependent methyltransferase [Salinivirgaceae bacterium]